jgi:predicted Fe-S protein YdhL (DUF1289 family)
MTYITSKTHLYIKVRYYASDYMLRSDNWQSNPRARTAQMLAAGAYTDFYRSFIEKFSGHPYPYYQYEYMCGSSDASLEEIHEITGVKICCTDGHYIYCIPKTTLGYEIYNWVLTNCKCKHTILKKTRGSFMDGGVTTWMRASFKTSPEMKARFNTII